MAAVSPSERSPTPPSSPEPEENDTRVSEATARCFNNTRNAADIGASGLLLAPFACLGGVTTVVAGVLGVFCGCCLCKYYHDRRNLPQ